jgi:hypothetical protein
MKKKQPAMAVTRIEIAYIYGKSLLQLVLTSELSEIVRKEQEDPSSKL